MRTIFVFIAFLSLMGCSQKISEDDIPLLNGYWEIKEVRFPDGTKKEYKVSTIVDYIEINGMKGFRKKVQPRFDGTYFASEDFENFTLGKKGDGFEIYYKNAMSDWTEKLTALSKEGFTVINADNISYTYQRFHNINVKENGETKK